MTNEQIDQITVALSGALATAVGVVPHPGAKIVLGLIAAAVPVIANSYKKDEEKTK